MKQRLKKILLSLVYWSGILHIVRFLHRKEIVIFTLHGIIEDPDNPWPVMRPHCSFSRYKNVLGVLCRYFEFVSLDEAVSMLDGTVPLRPYCAVLTFDDGYRNNIDVAMPILKKYNIPAVFFLPTGYVESRCNLWFDVADYVLQYCDEFLFSVKNEKSHFVKNNGKVLQWQQMRKQLASYLYSYNQSVEDDRAFQAKFFLSVARLEHDTGIDILETLAGDPRVAIMTWEDARTAYLAGVTIGSHSVDHLKLGSLKDPDCIRQQLKDSQKAIEEHVGCRCEYLCYPNGSYDDRVIEIARQCGYRAAATTRSGLNAKGCDLFQLNRTGFPLRAEKKHIFSHVYHNACMYGFVRKQKYLDRKKRIRTRRDEEERNPDTQKSWEDRGDGQERIVKNVWVGWVAQFVYLIAGFILPRMIDNSMGQAGLGAWDFSWTLITYFGLVQAGVVSSVNRYIAKYQAVGDVENINISASSVACVLLAMASTVVLLTVGAYHLLPIVVGDRLGEYLQETRWVVVWLGLSLTSQVSFAVFGGVLAGSFRWDIHYYINVASRVATLVGMVLVLSMGGGLATLALIYFLCEAGVLSLRVVYAYRVQPALRIRLSLVRRQRVREMLFYGLKTYLPVVGDMLTNQTMNLLVVWFFGPAVLAVYARPRALIRHVQTFMTRYAYVLVPTASSIHAKEDANAMHDLLVRSSRTGAYILFPVVLFLAVCGDALIEVWMGKDYVKPYLIRFLIAAFFPLIFTLPAVSLLAGANKHGKIGASKLLSSMVGIIFAYIGIKYLHIDITIAVLLFGVPVWLYGLIYVPHCLRENFDVGISKLLISTIYKPVLIMLPYGLMLVYFFTFFYGNAMLQVLSCVFLSMIFLPIVYWIVVLPDTFKNKVKYFVLRIF